MSSSNGISKDALDTYGAARDMSSTYGNRATATSNILTPTLNQMATAPTGFGQQTIGNMNTAATQGVGGATAGAVGGGNQAAARTNNAGGYAPAAAAAAHDATSQLSDAALGVQNQNAMLKQQQQQEGLSGLENMYGTNTGASENALGLSTSALNTATAAKQQKFNEYFNYFKDINDDNAEVAAAAAGSFCPVKGTLYLMADGSTKAVEEIRCGDGLLGIGDDTQTVEEVQSSPAPVVRVETEDGHVVRNSFTHAYALPRGGFVVASRAMGTVILTAQGPSRVISVTPDGVDTVFNVITDGSHTYCADGVWSLGVGDAERRIDMSTWARLGSQLAEVAHA